MAGARGRATACRRDVCRSKHKARRKPVPDELLVALINACFKADVNNGGYVAPPDEVQVIDGLLDDGLSK
jgi:hypothetical protein